MCRVGYHTVLWAMCCYWAQLKGWGSWLFSLCCQSEAYNWSHDPLQWPHCFVDPILKSYSSGVYAVPCVHVCVCRTLDNESGFIVTVIYKYMATIHDTEGRSLQFLVYSLAQVKGLVSCTNGRCSVTTMDLHTYYCFCIIYIYVCYVRYICVRVCPCEWERMSNGGDVGWEGRGVCVCLFLSLSLSVSFHPLAACIKSIVCSGRGLAGFVIQLLGVSAKEASSLEFHCQSFLVLLLIYPCTVLACPTVPHYTSVLCSSCRRIYRPTIIYNSTLCILI